MKDLPKTINTVEELDEILSRPTNRIVEFMQALDGDIMILGAGGKVGPTLALKALRAIQQAGVDKKVIAVDCVPLPELRAAGAETLQVDLLDMDAVKSLPQVKNVLYLVGRKFGSTGSEHLTWAINCIVPYHVASSLKDAKVVVYSTGCVYPVVDVKTGGATEATPPDPVGEYAQSCLGRERMFDYYSHTNGLKVLQFRLNYALELRYGVLADVATKVFNGRPIDVTTGYANGLWQGDVAEQTIMSLELAESPSRVLNITGPETFTIRDVAKRFGAIFGKEPIFEGEENGCGYLNNATTANALFGNPTAPLGVVIDWIAHWISIGGENSGKPTHFETQDGKY